jgi:hypothetical protein
LAEAQQSMDSHAWWPQDWSELQQKADGLAVMLRASARSSPLMAKLMPDGSRQQNDQIFVQSLREITGPKAAARSILAVRDGMDNVQRLECSRDWRRIHLWGATHGLAFQPLNQMYERVDRERQTGIQPAMREAVRGLPGADVWQASMPFRWAIRHKSRVCCCGTKSPATFGT